MSSKREQMAQEVLRAHYFWVRQDPTRRERTFGREDYDMLRLPLYYFAPSVDGDQDPVYYTKEQLDALRATGLYMEGLPMSDKIMEAFAGKWQSAARAAGLTDR